MDGDTKQPLVDDKRECNLPKKIKQGGDAASCNSDKEEEECYTDDGVDEVVDERSPNKNSGDASSEINQRVKRLQKKHVKRLDTEQPKDTDTRVYNQQKESKKDTEEASAQSDEERKACDTSVGKCIKVKNENNDVQPAGDGPRQRISNKKKNLEENLQQTSCSNVLSLALNEACIGSFVIVVYESINCPKDCEMAHLGKGDIPDHDAKTKRSSVAADTFSWYILLAILLSLLALVVLIFWFGRTSSPPVEKEFTLLEIFYQEMDKVQESFPNQHREVWRRSRIHLKEHLNLTNPTEPVSLILTSGREAEKTLGCLAQRLAAAFSNAVNSSVLGIDGTSKSAQNSDDVKLDIDKTLKEAFESGTQAAVIHRFEELPPGSTLIFYRYCDHENSAFKKVFLAFTVMLQEEMAFPPNVSLGMVEEMVQEYLKEKFVSSDRTVEFNKMDLDKLSGLWSRISHLILPVAAEQKIEQNGCQT